MKVYVDDMLVKSRRSQDHLEYLEQAFSVMRSYVGGGKILGYMVSERGIEANPEKIQTIMNLRSPFTIKIVQKLTGKIASLNRSLPFFKVLRKTKNFEWNEEYEKALQELTEYMTKPPLLANPKEGETLFLYLAMSENAVSSVLVSNEGESQNPVYYVSKMLQGAESRLIKWAVELGQYDVDYQPRTVQKAQVLADFVIKLANDPELPQTAGGHGSKWMLDVDRSSNANNGGAVTNNEAEYEALILGLELAHEAGARVLEAFTDSQLVALQIEGTYETREKTMTSYKEIVPKAENDKADALSKFGAAMSGIKDRRITALGQVQVVSDAGSWKGEIIKYLEDGILPSDPIAARRVKFRATRLTGETAFGLVCGTEAIIPGEIGEESRRIATYDLETNQDERNFDLTKSSTEATPGGRSRVEESGGLEKCWQTGTAMGGAIQSDRDQEERYVEAARYARTKFAAAIEYPKLEEVLRVKSHQLLEDRISSACERPSTAGGSNFWCL
ncbi:UNVERIFIED_CONTAM: hypothetical protein Sindi_0064500 [Sesamum indicum]